jgi:uncharacterized iron-regulated protein
VNLETVFNSFADVDVVLVGEVHDDPVAHAIEYSIFKACISSYKSNEPSRKNLDSEQQKRELILSFEMFEADIQTVVDEFVSGLISEADLLRDSRPWPNYQSDYQQLLLLSRHHNVQVLAANAPRRYVSLAGREGIEIASEKLANLENKTWNLPPMHLLTASPAYRQKFLRYMSPKSAMTAIDLEEGKTCPYIGLRMNDNMLDAQVLWDATMATNINDKLKAHRSNNPLVLHVNGKFHSEEGLGVAEKLRQLDPTIRIRIVTLVPTLPEEDLSTLQQLPVDLWNHGDYVILTNSQLKRSYQSEHPV